MVFPGVRAGVCASGVFSREDASESALGGVRSGARRGGSVGPFLAGAFRLPCVVSSPMCRLAVRRTRARTSMLLANFPASGSVFVALPTDDKEASSRRPNVPRSNV